MLSKMRCSPLAVCLALSTLCSWNAVAYGQGNLPTPYTVVGGKVAISQFHSLEQPTTAEGIFLNALVYFLNAQERDEDGKLPAVTTDYDKHQFALEQTLTNQRTSSTYRCSLQVLVSDNIITVQALDIALESQVSVVKLTKRLSFEKLNPDKKPQHKEYLTEFATLFQTTVDGLLEYIASNEPPVVTHYKEIKNQQVVKGMTKAECLLALGKPVSIDESEGKLHWIYESYVHIFFDGETVVTVIN